MKIENAIERKTMVDAAIAQCAETKCNQTNTERVELLRSLYDLFLCLDDAGQRDAIEHARGILAQRKRG